MKVVIKKRSWRLNNDSEGSHIPAGSNSRSCKCNGDQCIDGGQYES